MKSKKYTTEFAELKNKVFSSVYVKDDSLHFVNDTEHFCFHHSRVCCEHVYIESIVGELNDLENTPILVAEMTQSFNRVNKHETWSFYKFGTVNGWVDIRWFGESNGNYSEEAKLYKVIPYHEYTQLDWNTQQDYLQLTNKMARW